MDARAQVRAIGVRTVRDSIRQGKRYTPGEVRLTAPERTERAMGQLEGKVALITGASKGIGRVMSRLFAKEGAAVVCAARSRDLVEETAALIKGDGGRAVAVTGDAATEGDV